MIVENFFIIAVAFCWVSFVSGYKCRKSDFNGVESLWFCLLIIFGALSIVETTLIILKKIL